MEKARHLQASESFLVTGRREYISLFRNKADGNETPRLSFNQRYLARLFLRSRGRVSHQTSLYSCPLCVEFCFNGFQGLYLALEFRTTLSCEKNVLHSRK